MCVFIWCLWMKACSWHSMLVEVIGQPRVSSPSTLFETRLTDSCAFGDSPVTNSHPSIGALEISDTLYSIQLNIGSGDSSSGPHTWIANVLHSWLLCAFVCLQLFILRETHLCYSTHVKVRNQLEELFLRVLGCQAWYHVSLSPEPSPQPLLSVFIGDISICNR